MGALSMDSHVKIESVSGERERGRNNWKDTSVYGNGCLITI